MTSDLVKIDVPIDQSGIGAKIAPKNETVAIRAGGFQPKP
jgi:hypothetical protein